MTHIDMPDDVSIEIAQAARCTVAHGIARVHPASQGIENAPMHASLLQIRLFVAVYEEGSFTSAGLREGIGQSGVSQHVRQLEHQLGVALFNRDRLIEATPAGQVFYQRCIKLLRQLEQVSLPLHRDSRRADERLRVGLIPTVTRSLLGATLLAFQATHPMVTIEVTEGYAGVLVEAVRRGQLDFAVVPRVPELTRGVQDRLICRTPAFLVSSPRSELAHGLPVRLAEVKPLRLILPGDPRFRRALLERYLTEQCVEVTARLDQIESTLGALELVRTSHWRMVMTGLFVVDDLATRRFTLNPIVDPILWEDILLIEPARQPISSAGEAFVDILRQTADEVDRVPHRVAHGEPLARALVSPEA